MTKRQRILKNCYDLNLMRLEGADAIKAQSIGKVMGNLYKRLHRKQKQKKTRTTESVLA